MSGLYYDSKLDCSLLTLRGPGIAGVKFVGFQLTGAIRRSRAGLIKCSASKNIFITATMDDLKWSHNMSTFEKNVFDVNQFIF